MIKRLLIANRGEIAVRVIRAARDLGIETVAIFSAADAEARHASLADRAVCVGPAPATESYLREDLVLHVAGATGCDAVHPGYGFLAESARFATRVAEEGLVFVGPPARAIEEMGNKAVARTVVEGAGVSAVPGSAAVVSDLDEAVQLADQLGYPVLAKASAGGGGRGMRVVRDATELKAAVPLAQQEAASAFGDDSVYIEKYLPRVRHVEVQILADRAGNTLSLGERDCSLQRRHQKMLEEAPSPVLGPEQRRAMSAAAVDVARAVGYIGAGTVESLFDLDSEAFYFIEMNTRIQVEHPVTEMLTSMDLVAWQLRIAAGEQLPAAPPDIRGHAVECRITAEDWKRDFVPGPGTMSAFTPPAGPGVRLDTHSFPGVTVPPHYDSLLAKLVVHGENRDEALRRARRALDEFHIEGIPTTVGLHRWLLDQPQIIEGNYTTSYLSEAL